MTDLPETTLPDPPPAVQRLERTGRGEEMALVASWEAHRVELLAFLLRMTRDREVAEDLLSETFIRLITEVRAGRMPERVRPWLYRVAANAAISRGRHGAVFSRLLPRLLDRREPVRPEGEALRLEQESELHSALAELSPDGRAALLLAAQGFAGREIAASIGRTEVATRALMCRSRVQLRLVLEARGGQP